MGIAFVDMIDLYNKAGGNAWAEPHTGKISVDGRIMLAEDATELIMHKLGLQALDNMMEAAIKRTGAMRVGVRVLSGDSGTD
jgi:hypothetical protein